MPDTLDASAALETLERRLRTETEGDVYFDTASRGRYATDASAYQIMPLGVFVPRSESDVAAAIDIARELKIPILPRGAGSSQAGQAIGAALVIDGTTHLRHVIEIDVGKRTATVEPGIVLDELNAQLKPHGLWFPVDIDSSEQATLGGMAGNNASGPRSIVHGSMVHNVLGVSAWLSSGELLEFGPVSYAQGRAAEIGDYLRALAVANKAELAAHWPKLQSRVAGYNLDIFDRQGPRPYTEDGSVNLAHLLVGSEGTLAYTRSLTLKLAEIPRVRLLALISFEALADAMAMVRKIVASLEPSAMELLDAAMTEACRPALLIEFSGDEKPGRKTRMAELVHLLGEMGHHDCVRQVFGEAAQARVWAAR
jgi:FAD/FMN-containing dehydrogenase